MARFFNRKSMKINENHRIDQFLDRSLIDFCSVLVPSWSRIPLDHGKVLTGVRHACCRGGRHDKAGLSHGLPRPVGLARRAVLSWPGRPPAAAPRDLPRGAEAARPLPQRGGDSPGPPPLSNRNTPSSWRNSVSTTWRTPGILNSTVCLPHLSSARTNRSFPSWPHVGSSSNRCELPRNQTLPKPVSKTARAETCVWLFGSTFYLPSCSSFSLNLLTWFGAFSG